MKSINEIKERAEIGFENDFFGFGVGDIIAALPFDEVKSHLEEEFINKPDAKEEWEALRLKNKDDVVAKMKDYLLFAFDKARNQRGLSADRSIQHFIAWSWLIDDDFYEELVDLYDSNYGNYGLPILTRIEEWLEDKDYGNM